MLWAAGGPDGSAGGSAAGVRSDCHEEPWRSMGVGGESLAHDQNHHGVDSRTLVGKPASSSMGVFSWHLFSISSTFQPTCAVLVLMCGEGIFEVEEMANPKLFPPTFFAYMPIDEDNSTLNSTRKDAKAMAILSEQGVKVYDTQLWPNPLSPLFFTERILCVSDEMSRKIFAAYQGAGWLDSNGYLMKNAWVEDWKSVLWEANALPFCTSFGDLCLAAHVLEELNMAFAEHSFTSDANDVISPWLDSNILTYYYGDESGPHILLSLLQFE